MSILRGNALKLPLRDGSVDLIVTSPPYFALRSYRDGDEHYDGQIGSESTPKDFLDALIAATREMVRVLKPTGSIFVNLGDKYAGSGGAKPGSYSAQTKYGKKAAEIAYKRPETEHEMFQMWRKDWEVRSKSLVGIPWRYAIRCIDELELILRAEIVWSKPNGLPESVTDRVRRSHENWFHFTKEPHYFSGIDEIREPHAAVSLKRAQPPRANVLAHEDRHEVDMSKACHPLGRLPGSVWSIPTEPLSVPVQAIEKYGLPNHFAAFPQEWPRRLILGWSPQSGTVLDPFGGTGTVAGVAKSLGRTGISLDLSHDYCKLARWRIAESGHFSKSEQRTLKERQGVLA